MRAPRPHLTIPISPVLVVKWDDALCAMADPPSSRYYQLSQHADAGPVATATSPVAHGHMLAV